MVAVIIITLAIVGMVSVVAFLISIILKSGPHAFHHSDTSNWCGGGGSDSTHHDWSDSGKW